MRYVDMIAHEKLKRMRSRWKRYHDLSLAIAKMNVIIIRRNGPTNINIIHIDEKMVMTGQRFHDPGGRDAHSAQADLNGEALRHANAIEGVVEIHLRPFWRRHARLAGGAGGRRSRLRHWRAMLTMTLAVVLREGSQGAPSQDDGRRRQHFFRCLVQFRPPRLNSGLTPARSIACSACAPIC
jgi:hypothetical protein